MHHLLYPITITVHDTYRRYRPPTPFDWEAAAPEVQQQRTRCYLEVSIDKCVVASGWMDCILGLLAGGGWMTLRE